MRNQITLETLKGRIFRIRGQQVMLGQDLAQLYESTPGALMQAVKRNAFRFPVDFMFQLSEAEFDRLKSQIVISKGFVKLRHALTHNRDLIRRVEKMEGKIGLVETDIRFLRQDVREIRHPLELPAKPPLQVKGFENT